MSNEIVIIQASETLAPTPASLQSFGAFVSQGGTTLTEQSTAQLTSPSSLTSLLAANLAITSLAWSGGTVTATTTAAHGYTTGDTFLTTIAGASPTNYNGTVLATVTGASAFTYPLASDGGTTPATGTITYTPRGVAELVAMNTQWWAQPNSASLSVYVLEVGQVENPAAITALGTYLTNNPNSAYVPGATNYFYSYLVPREWAGEMTFQTLAGQYSNITSRTNFFVTMTSANYSSWAATNIRVFGLVEAPVIPPTEFSTGSPFFTSLNLSPSTTNKVPPICYSFCSATTAYPLAGNATTLANFKAAAVNYIGLGSEGGISANILEFGTMLGGLPFNFYYSADWAQINVKLSLANAVINGSNTTINPLYYNQDGINRLQSVAANTLNTGVSAGLILGNVIQTELDQTTFARNVSNGLYTGNCVVNAIQFQTYVTQNPGNYGLGIYGGLSCVMTPLLGFSQIIFNFDFTTFA